MKSCTNTVEARLTGLLCEQEQYFLKRVFQKTNTMRFRYMRIVVWCILLVVKHDTYVPVYTTMSKYILIKLLTRNN